VNFLFHNNFFIFIARIINYLNNKLLKICIEMDYAREGVSINISLAPFGNLLEKTKKQNGGYLTGVGVVRPLPRAK
jgi:hypothetical protein